MRTVKERARCRNSAVNNPSRHLAWPGKALYNVLTARPGSSPRRARALPSTKNCCVNSARPLRRDVGRWRSHPVRTSVSRRPALPWQRPPQRQRFSKWQRQRERRWQRERRSSWERQPPISWPCQLRRAALRDLPVHQQCRGPGHDLRDADGRHGRQRVLFGMARVHARRPDGPRARLPGRCGIQLLAILRVSAIVLVPRARAYRVSRGGEFNRGYTQPRRRLHVYRKWDGRSRRPPALGFSTPASRQRGRAARTFTDVSGDLFTSAPRRDGPSPGSR